MYDFFYQFFLPVAANNFVQGFGKYLKNFNGNTNVLEFKPFSVTF